MAPSAATVLAEVDSRRAASLFEALVCEVHAAALQTAVVASAANAIGRGRQPIPVSAIEPFVPRDSAVLQVLRMHLIEQGVSIDDVMFVDEFLLGLAEGRAAFASFRSDTGVLGEPRARVLHERSLSGAWRRLAHSAMLAVRELAVPLHRRLPPAYGENSSTLMRLLAEAEGGGTPCVDGRGRLFYPPMPQQRRFPRHLLCQECTIRYRDREAEAFARDVSMGGLGLERTPPLLIGEYVLVALRGGRELRGTIVWSSGGSAGLRFSVPLHALDPLIAA